MFLEVLSDKEDTPLEATLLEVSSEKEVTLPAEQLSEKAVTPPEATPLEA